MKYTKFFLVFNHEKNDLTLSNFPYSDYICLQVKRILGKNWYKKCYMTLTNMRGCLQQDISLSIDILKAKQFYLNYLMIMILM